jgi:type II secretory pathway pseudopilin PulG
MKLKKIAATLSNNPQQGFSLFETVVAAMISILFVSLGANLVLSANMYKVVAKKNEAMNSLIQSDVDGIKYQAQILQKSTSLCTTGYGSPLKTALGTDVKRTDVKILGNTYILTRTLEAIPTDNKDILPISYTFQEKPKDSTSTAPPSEYNLHIEIIPNAALSCST